MQIRIFGRKKPDRKYRNFCGQFWCAQIRLSLVKVEDFSCALSSSNTQHLLSKGQNVDFVVLDPVTINGTIVIKSGTHVTAQVTKKKNNCILGIPGEIQIGNFKLINSNNDVINLRGTIVDKGTNRAWANIGWIIVWPLLFIKGNDGKVPAGSYHILYTIGDTFFNVGQSYNRY